MSSRGEISAGPKGRASCTRLANQRGTKSFCWLVVWGMTCIAVSPQTLAGDPALASASGTTEKSEIKEWLNQMVRLRETVQVTDRPSADAKPSAEIRAGAEIKAIGVVAGGQWIEVELPDHSQGFVPKAAIAYEQFPITSASQAPTPAPAPPTAPATAPVQASATTAASALSPASASSPATIRGKVVRVPNAATLVVGDQRIRLSGIDPGPTEVLGPFENWLRNQGDLACETEAQTGRYRCFTSSGVDVAEAAILNGTGRVGDGAVPEYRDSEAQARQARRGLWQ
jgi:endonuclease YncB( thermonuclease family)